MGHTKRNYEQMQIDELVKHFFTHQEDEDYQYELWREHQEQAEQDAYEQHLADKYSNGY